MTDVERRCRRPCALIALAVLATGCASTGQEATPRAEGSTLEQIRRALDEGARSNAAGDTPSDVRAALMPEVAPELPAPEDELRFDLSVNEAPARAFFMGLVEGTSYNMVVHPDVRGTVSLELKDVTVPDVMQIAQRVYGYEYERRRNGYVVLPARLQSRIFHVDYLNVNRRGESNMRVNSGQVSETRDDDAGGSSRRTPSSRIETSADANFWGRLEATVRSVLGPGDGRSVVVDPEAGLVVVRAMPGELRDVEAYLQAAQDNLQRQVILEAKILEVRLSAEHEAGINWAALAEASNGDRAFAGQTTLTQGESPVLTEGGAFDPSSITRPGGASRFDFGGLFAVGARTTDFAALIRLLDTQGDVQVLSSPRVSTVNNQKAVIKVGTDEFFVTDIETQRDIGTTAASRSLDVELTPFFSGIALDVTPQIGRRGDVTLHVHPSVSDVRDQTKNIVIAGEQQSLPLAFSSVRESDSVVRARDGQVIVIGGLMQDQATRRRAQAGGLGSIPLLGMLFRQKADSSERTELVILLRPVIADAGSDWSGQMNEFSDRLRQRSRDGGGEDTPR